MSELKADFAHGARIPGMVNNKDYQPQARYVSHEGRFDGLRKLAGGLTRRLSGAFEQASSGEKQVILGQITKINVAKMLDGLSDDRHTTMQMEPFTRSEAFASLGYLGGVIDHPNEYAAMLFAQRELVRDQVLAEEPNPDVPGTFWFKVIDPKRLTDVATTKDPQSDKSLVRELTLMRSAEQRVSYVKDFLQKNQVRLDLAA